MTNEQVIETVKTYKGNNKFLNSLQKSLKGYGSLTERQMAGAVSTIEGSKRHEQSQKELNIKLVGDTIKIGRTIALGIKKEYELEFHPMLIDVTSVTGMTDKALRIKGNLTKENGGICRCCGKTLTDEISKVTGIGPVCSKYVGVPHPVSTTMLKDYNSEMSKKIDEIGEFEFWVPKKAIVKWNGMGGVMVKM
jgi:hypothetical protein|tara:strand:- start:14 stop:592 length:579 start_codon:yes stop_codon:yes gene_type:complete